MLVPRNVDRPCDDEEIVVFAERVYDEVVAGVSRLMGDGPLAWNKWDKWDGVVDVNGGLERLRHSPTTTCQASSTRW